MADRFLSVREAADYLGVSKSLAYRSIDEGTWPTEVVRVGARKLIPAAALYALAGDNSDAAAHGASDRPAVLSGPRGNLERQAS